MEEIKEGDVVRLKSGGPLMTVIGNEREGCRCAWFDKNEEVKVSTFANYIIKKIED